MTAQVVSYGGGTKYWRDAEATRRRRRERWQARAETINAARRERYAGSQA